MPSMVCLVASGSMVSVMPFGSRSSNALVASSACLWPAWLVTMVATISGWAVVHIELDIELVIETRPASRMGCMGGSFRPTLAADGGWYGAGPVIEYEVSATPVTLDDLEPTGEQQEPGELEEAMVGLDRGRKGLSNLGCC
jgi:hypothetical protein